MTCLSDYEIKLPCIWEIIKTTNAYVLILFMMFLCLFSYLKLTLFCGMRSICFIHCGSIFVIIRIALIMSSINITVFLLFWRNFSLSRFISLLATKFHLFYFEIAFDSFCKLPHILFFILRYWNYHDTLFNLMQLMCQLCYSHEYQRWIFLNEIFHDYTMDIFNIVLHELNSKH